MVDLFLGRTNALRWGWRAFFFYVVTSFTYGMLVWALHHVGGLAAMPEIAYVLSLFAVLLSASWLFVTLEGRSLRSLGLHLGRAWAVDFAKGACLGAAIIALSAGGAFAWGGFHLVRTGFSGLSTLGAGALVYLVPALNEELAFRGYIFQRLERSLGPWPSLLVMALLFGAAHLGNPGLTDSTRILAMVNIVLAGCLLGLAYLRTRSLGLSMGLHLGWNWAQGAVFGFDVSGTPVRGFLLPVLHRRPDWITGGSFGLEGSVLCTIVCLAACMLLLCLHPAGKDNSFN